LNRLKLIFVCLFTLLSPGFLTFGLYNASAQGNRGRTLPRPDRGRPVVGHRDPLPPLVTRKPMRSGPKTRAGKPISAQTVDITPNTPTVIDSNPFWAKDEQTIVIQSNRTDLQGTVAGTNFHIYRMRSDGSNVQAVTGPLSSPVTGATTSQTDPAINSASSAVVYVDTDASGNVDLVELNLATKTTRSLVKNNSDGFGFTGLNNPEYGFVPGGNVGVLFAGRLASFNNYRLFAVDVQSGKITMLTGQLPGTNQPNPGFVADDKNPSVSPDSQKPVVAFDSNRSNPNGTATQATRNIWAIGTNPNIQSATQVSNFSPAGIPSDNVEPAWSTDKVDQPTGNQTIVGGQQLLAFASTRYDTAGDGNANAVNPNGTHDIYWLKVSIGIDPSNPTVFTVTSPESTGNPAFKLSLSDPQHKYDDRHPTWPQFINTYRVAFDSDRTFYNAAANDSGPAGQPRDIFASTLIDLNSPTLVRFNDVTGDVLSVQPRLAVPGSDVKISVKLADFETGIRDVYAQVKNPNSKYQSADGQEHKVFLQQGLPIGGQNVAQAVPIEFEMQRIFIGADPSDSRVNSYADPQYIASSSDFFAFSGATSPPEAGWLPLQLESRDPVTGVSTYSATWRTDVFPTDYVVDVIVYDNAVNPFSTGPADAAVNWKIYDNVWGFTTQPFLPNNNLLFVSDYSSGQKFFGSRFGATTLVNVAHTFWGSESWMTDIDVSLLPGAYVNGTTTGSLIDVRNTLGVNSYFDGLDFDGTTVDGFPLAPTQRYDMWRILCRGPVPDSVLQQYAPHVEQQPADIVNGESAPRNVQVAPRCIIWNAPYTGNLFVGPGTLMDLQVQAQLHSFLQSGGRVLFNGQDIAWALTLGGTSASGFVSSDLRATYVNDSPAFSLSSFGSGPFNFFPVWGISGAYLLTAAGAVNPITHDPWDTVKYFGPNPHHSYPGPPFPDGFSDFISNEPNFLVGGNDQNNPRLWGSPGVVFPDVVTPAANVVSDMTYGGGGTAIQHYVDSSTGQRVVYAPMGLEALFPDTFAPPNTQNILQSKNRRMELIHNAICWMRTGSITGIVLDTEGGSPVAGVLVRLSRRQDAQGRPIIEYTATTAQDGSYAVNGVEADMYEVNASKPGFQIQKRTTAVTHGGFRSDVSFRMTEAAGASIKGKVTRTDGTTPVVGATVTATNIADPTQTFTATTDANGTYQIDRVPAFARYTLTVTAPGFGASIPLSYTVEDPNDPTGNKFIQPATNYGPFDFQLKAEPGSLTGTVKVANPTNDPNFPPDGTAIAGATVTATCGPLTATAVTDANGNFSFSPTNTPANGLDPGTCTLVATAPGYAPNSPVSVVIVSAQTATAAITLAPIAPGQLSGLVTRTSDGAPLSGVLITLKDPAGNTVATTTTGAPQTVNGYTFNYRFASVPAGVSYTVSASLAGFTPTQASQTAAVTSGVETKGVNFQMEPLHTFPGALSLVSAPYEYAQAGTGRVADLLSVTDLASFLFVTWDVGGYIFYPTPPADTFHLGRGYFMAYKNNLPLSTIGTPADVTRPFDINLNAGWNLIGDPFDFEIDWTKVDVVVDGVVKTHDQAVSEGIIGPALYSYASGSYLLDFKLTPWKGYWARAYRNATLRIDPVNDRFGRAAANGSNSRAVLQGGQGWSLNLRVKAGTAHDDDNYIGVSSRAVDGFDGFKAEKPPVFGQNYVHMTFDHDDWGERSGGYGMDVRSASVATKTWDFSVRTDVVNGTATIMWPNIANVGRATTLTLTDLTSGSVRDLRTSGGYSWPTGETPGVRKFRIAATRTTMGDTLRISDISARQPSRSSGVNIGFNLSSAANVDIRILAVSGGQVRKVTGRASRAAGVNQVTWDLKNDQNAAVPSGSYMVEIRAQSADGRSNVRQVAPITIAR
jgi:hypothetical protein